MLDAIEKWPPIAILVLLGGVGGGLLFLRSVLRYLGRSAQERSPVLQYSRVDAVLNLSKGALIGVEARAFIENPEEFSVRLRVVEMRTSFSSTVTNQIPRKFEVFDFGAGMNAVINSPPISLPMPLGTNEVIGRIDWTVECIALDPKGNEVGPTSTFELHGRMEIHRFQHGYEARWVPDPGSQVPALDEGKYYRDANGELHWTERNAPIE